MSKVKVAVVMGGPSSEYEVSLNSGEAMLASLDKAKYQVSRVVINKVGKWHFNDQQELAVTSALDELKRNTDIVLLAVHGTFGEDGTLQALLEQRGIAYTGSSAAASLLAMDKIISNDIYQGVGLNIPETYVFEATEKQQAIKAIQKMALPIVIKPVRQGSSVGVSIVKDASTITSAVDLALRYDQRVMVQEYILGREVSCGVLEKPGSRDSYALPPTELIPKKGDFFNYDSKYLVGGAEEITPPDMPAAMISKIQETAIAAHNLLGCHGYSRTDMIVRGEDVIVIETNTLPGMTRTSILPQQAVAAEISFAQLLDRIIQCGLKRPISPV